MKPIAMIICMVYLVTQGIFLCSCKRSSEYQDVGENYRNDKLSNAPEYFISYTRDVFYEYRLKHDRYPSRWAYIPTIIWLRTAPIKKEILKDLIMPDSPVLIAYNDKSRKECFKYIIARADKDNFLVYSENNVGVQNWVMDKDEKWWYFPDEKTELVEIEKRKDKLVQAIKKYTYNTRSILSQLSHFHHKNAFLILFEYLEDKNQLFEIRQSLSSKISHFPKLYRFRKYLNRFKKIQKEIAELKKHEKNESRLKRLYYFHKSLNRIIEKISP